MTGSDVRVLADFVGDLERLRRLAAQPSLNRLVALSASLDHPLARSTISDKLNAKSLPDWDFVASFVTACAAHAAEVGTPLDPAAVDLRAWDAKYLQMLTLIDTARESDRLAAAAAIEIARRDPARARSGRIVPRQLPPTVPSFVGRAIELDLLRRAAEDLGGEGATPIVTIHGAAGIGKTSLALHFAHLNAPSYPDGQLYVDLRGFHPTGSPMSEADALRGFLDALEVGPDRRPASGEAQAALYRSLLNGRRILVVLDNARDWTQLRPLLPAASTCLVVVTSRDRLAGLAALQGSRPITLGLLTAEESQQVLASRIGPTRVATETAAAEEIARYCLGLPLALSVVASRAATHPGIGLAQLAAELRATRGALDPLDLGDGEAGVRTALSWSYHRLSPAAAEMFRLLGAYPAAEITVTGAAGLASVAPGAARSALAELVRVHLLDWQTPGRYVHHDLIRAYAAELADSLDDTMRHAAVERVLDLYTRRAYAAALLLAPLRAPTCTRPGPTEVDLPDAGAALAWFTVERSVLIDVITFAANTGFDTQAIQLGWALFDFINRHGRWGQWVMAQRLALAACQRSGGPADEAYATYALGLTLIHVGHAEEAATQLRHALDLYRALGDLAGAANTHLNLGGMAQLHGDYRSALDHAEDARRLFEKAGNQSGVARSTNGVAWCHAQLGNYAEATRHIRSALELQQDLGDRQGEANTWDSLGYVCHQQGDHQQAARCYRRALELSREIGDRHHEAELLDHLGDNDLAAGAAQAAHDHWLAASAILDELGHADADRLREKANLSGNPSDSDDR